MIKMTLKLYIDVYYRMPTHEENLAAKKHLQKVDNAQELILAAMFHDLRINYEIHISKRENKDKPI